MEPSIYSWIKSEEAKFETEEIQVGQNWYWNFRNHVQLIFHLMHGVFFTGENNWLRAFKQIMRPLIRLSLWTEDIEVKDVFFFIESHTGRVLSFLTKKYHDEVYTREHDIDTFFDELAESDIPYGGAIAQKGVERPEIVPLQSVAFCDQTDILGGPLAFKHNFSPDKLRSMAKYGWGEEKNGATISLDDLCTMATFEKDSAGSINEKQNQVPGKTIEVYIVRGNMPEHYLKDNDNMEDYYNQLQIVAFYTDKDSKKQGVSLYRKKEEEGNLKVLISEPVYQRALGYCDGEAYLHPQIWSNFLTIHKMGMLEAGSKVPLWTDDDTFTSQKVQDMENLEVMKIAEGKTIGQIPTAAPANVQLLERTVNEWYESAQLNGSAFDSLQGKEESSGMTFRGQERLIAQGRGWHDRRRGKRAKFIEEVYRDWIIPDMVKEITKGKKFLATLTSEEMKWVADQLSTHLSNRRINDIVLKMEAKDLTPEKLQSLSEMREMMKGEFLKQGNKHLIEILKDEFKDVEIKMGINIAGKQKNLAAMSDKVLSILEVAMANPQFKQNLEANGMMGPFNDLLEYSGISPVDFATFQSQAPAMPTAQPQQAPQLAASPEQI